MNRPKTYKDNFYTHYIESSSNSAKEIIPIILKYITPESVLDVGCGSGAWLKVWKDFGVKNVKGLDTDYVRFKELQISKDEFKVCDLENKFSIDSKYDLVTCLEVAEHLKPESARVFINSLCSCSDIILFSAAIPGQEGTSHLNEQNPNYWINIFAENNFEAFDFIREIIWDNSKISFWYRQNLFILIHNDSLNKYSKITKEKKKVKFLVHPELLAHKESRINDFEKILKNPFKTANYFFKKYSNGFTKLFKK